MDSTNGITSIGAIQKDEVTLWLHYYACVQIICSFREITDQGIRVCDRVGMAKMSRYLLEELQMFFEHKFKVGLRWVTLRSEIMLSTREFNKRLAVI